MDRARRERRLIHHAGDGAFIVDGDTVDMREHMLKWRYLIVQDGVSPATSSHLVGYESSSQFSQEFKRFFGRTPATEAAIMKNALIQLSAQPTSAYVTA